jgi:hypothetical protein
VHAAAAVLLGFRGVPDVLDHGAVGDEFVVGLGGGGVFGVRVGRGGRGAVDEGFEDGLLVGGLVGRGTWGNGSGG